MEERIGLFDWVLINLLQEQPCDYTRSAAEWDWCNYEVYDQIYGEAAYLCDLIEFYSNKEV